MLTHKINLSKSIEIEIMQGILSDCNWIKVSISNKKMSEKSTNIWKLNNIFLNISQVQKSNKETQKIH